MRQTRGIRRRRGRTLGRFVGEEGSDGWMWARISLLVLSVDGFWFVAGYRGAYTVLVLGRTWLKNYVLGLWILWNRLPGIRGIPLFKLQVFGERLSIMDGIGAKRYRFVCLLARDGRSVYSVVFSCPSRGGCQCHPPCLRRGTTVHPAHSVRRAPGKTSLRLDRLSTSFVIDVGIFFQYAS